MNTEERQTFRKNERLCRRRMINEIFEHGSAFNTELFRVIWIISDAILPSPAQFAVTVPKRKFKLAVTRNLIKRRIREAYRKQKHILYSFLESQKLQIAFMIMYTGNSVADYGAIEASVKEVIGKLCRNAGKGKIKS